MCKEKEIKLMEIEVDLDEKTIEFLIDHAKNNIVNDTDTLINWAANDILSKKLMEDKDGTSKSDS